MYHSMNYKLEKFWNFDETKNFITFENMNYKLEKFWNNISSSALTKALSMNYKLEKFWNSITANIPLFSVIWTINLKSFEIHF